MKKGNKTMKKIKINVNDYRVDSGYSYRLVENSNLDELVNEVQHVDNESVWELDNESSIYGLDNTASLDEVFTPPAGFTESSSFDPEDDYNF